MRVLGKADALEALERHKRQLLRQPEECVMCALADGRDAELLVLRRAAGAVVLDRFGNRPHHLLVIAARHLEHPTQFDWPELSAVQRLAYDACHALERVLAPKRLYVAAFGSDSAAPMTFAHYHLHVVPIQEEGESARPAEVFSWSRGVVTYDAAEAARLVAELRRAFPKIEPA